MKKQLNVLCSIIALFCFVSMFMPVIAPRFPAGQYYAADEAIAENYFFTGEYYYAREYWSVGQFVFSTRDLFSRILLAVSEALLLYWAFYGVRGEAGKMGMIAAVLNLLVSAFVVIVMLRSMGSCRWAVLAFMALDAVLAVVLAAEATFSKK